jgi:hypothetical protein
LQQFFATVQKIYKTKPNFTEEELKEHERIGKEYYRQSTIENNKFEKDLANKIWLQQEAIRALPEELRKATLYQKVTPNDEFRGSDETDIKGYYETASPFGKNKTEK